MELVGFSWLDAIKTSTTCPTPSFTNILKKTLDNFCINIYAINNVVSKMDVFFDANTFAKKHSKWSYGAQEEEFEYKELPQNVGFN